VSWYLARELLPERRVVAHFRFPGLPRKGGELWVVFDGERSEVCRKDPGFEIELFVEAEPAALAEWHLGRIEWVDALRADRIRVVARPRWPGRCRPGTAAAPPPRPGAPRPRPAEPGSAHQRPRRISSSRMRAKRRAARAAVGSMDAPA